MSSIILAAVLHDYNNLFCHKTVPPHIPGADEKEFLRGIENHTIYIECPADGVPPPSILWLKDKVPIIDLSAHNAREISNGRQLELRTLQPSDAGDYTCQATNIAGQRKKTFALDILSM